MSERADEPEAARQPLSETVKQWILSQGYPLELKVSTQMRDQGFPRWIGGLESAASGIADHMGSLDN